MRIEGLSESDSERLIDELRVTVTMNPMMLTKLGEKIAAEPKVKLLVANYVLDQFDAFIEGSNLDQFALASVHADLSQQWSDVIDMYAYEFGVDRDAVLDVLQVMLRDEMLDRIQRACSSDANRRHDCEDHRGRRSIVV